MVLGPGGEIGNSRELHDRVAKKDSGRVIPIHPDLRSPGQAGATLTKPERFGHCLGTPGVLLIVA